jgi:hypothetical protein
MLQYGVQLISFLFSFWILLGFVNNTIQIKKQQIVWQGNTTNEAYPYYSQTSLPFFWRLVLTSPVVVVVVVVVSLFLLFVSVIRIVF